MKTKVVLAVFALMLLTSAAYAAEAASSNNAVVDGVGKFLRLPITMLDKATGNIHDSSSGAVSSEDVAVASVYNLDAETTG